MLAAYHTFALYTEIGRKHLVYHCSKCLCLCIRQLYYSKCIFMNYILLINPSNRQDIYSLRDMSGPHQQELETMELSYVG